MKKLILLSSLVFVIVIVATAHAKMTPYKPGSHNYDVEVYVEKGWNLILFPSLDNIKEDSEIKIENIKAGFFYFPDINSYAEFYPSETEFEESYYRIAARNPKEAEELGISSAWVYSDKSGNFKYSRIDVPEYHQVSLFSGWNFLTLTPEIKGKSLAEIKGDCVIEKAYVWNPEKQTWEGVGVRNDKFPETVIGHGVILKITNDCQLEKEIIPETPALPE